jgi:hypothetical protein
VESVCPCPLLVDQAQWRREKEGGNLKIDWPPVADQDIWVCQTEAVGCRKEILALTGFEIPDGCPYVGIREVDEAVTNEHEICLGQLVASYVQLEKSALI